MQGGGFRCRQRAGFSKLVRCRNFRCQFAVNGFQLRRLGQSILQQMLSEPRDGTARFPLVHFPARSVGKVSHPLCVRPRAIGLALKQGRTVAGARPSDSLAGSAMHREHIVAIHLHARQPVGGGARRHAGIPRHFG